MIFSANISINETREEDAVVADKKRKAFQKRWKHITGICCLVDRIKWDTRATWSEIDGRIEETAEESRGKKASYESQTNRPQNCNDLRDQELLLETNRILSTDPIGPWNLVLLLNQAEILTKNLAEGKTG